MAHKIICDKCGVEGAGKVTLDMARSTPLVIPNGESWRYDQDLCQKHFDEFRAELRGLFAKVNA